MPHFSHNRCCNIIGLLHFNLWSDVCICHSQRSEDDQTENGDPTLRVFFPSSALSLPSLPPHHALKTAHRVGSIDFCCTLPSPSRLRHVHTATYCKGISIPLSFIVHNLLESRYARWARSTVRTTQSPKLALQLPIIDLQRIEPCVRNFHPRKISTADLHRC